MFETESRLSSIFLRWLAQMVDKNSGGGCAERRCADVQTLAIGNEQSRTGARRRAHAAFQGIVIWSRLTHDIDAAFPADDVNAFARLIEEDVVRILAGLQSRDDLARIEVVHEQQRRKARANEEPPAP